MSRTIRKSYFDWNNQSFEKFRDSEIIYWSKSKNKKVWTKKGLVKCEDVESALKLLNITYKMSKTDNIYRESTRKRGFKNNVNSNIRNYYKKLSVRIIKDEIDVENVVYINDKDQKYLKWVWW